jgi:hypothetical protein
MLSRIYLDENVSEGLVRALMALGYDVISTTKAGNKGATDAMQLFFGLRQRRVVVTYNSTDFVLLDETLRLWAMEWGVTTARHAGILIIPNPRTIDNTEAARSIDELASSIASFEDRIFLWNVFAGWQELP